MPVLSDFTASLGSFLNLIGVPPAIVALVVLLYAIESYISNALAAIKLGRAAKRAGSTAITQILMQPTLRLFIAAILLGGVVTVQYVMVRLAYIVGSIISSAFDPVRRERFAVQPSSELLEIDSLSHYVQMDIISISFTGIAIFLMLISYGRTGGSIFVFLSLPCSFILFGLLSLLGLCVVIDLLIFGIPFIMTWGDFVGPSLTVDYAGDPDYYLLIFACFIYSLVALAASKGAGIVGTLLRGTPS